MDILRLKKVFSIIIKYGFNAWLADTSMPIVAQVVRHSMPQELLDKPVHERFKLMLEELGPIFIKFGQLLSTRPDILPPEFIASLSMLQEEVSPMPWDEMKEQLEAYLPAPIEEIFIEINSEPLATASVSQVHRARLKTGEEVVVKIRRPEIDDIIRADLDFLRSLARFLKTTIVEVSRHDPVSWVDEFATALDAELDLMNEVHAIESFRQNGSETGQLVVPQVYPEYSSSRIIVMEFLNGKNILSVEDPGERKRVARVIVAEAYRQVFVTGFFHADPHPGNIRYLEDGRIGMIDFGLVGRLTSRMKNLIIRFTMAAAFKDAEGVARVVYQAGVAKERVDIAALGRDIHELFGETLGKTLKEIDTKHIALEVMRVVSKHNITLPRDLALLGKAGINIEGVVRTLDPDIDISKEGLPYAKKLISIPTEPDELVQEVFKQFIKLRSMWDEIPIQLDQIILDVSSGKMNINITSKQLDGLVPAVREAGGIVAIGIVSGASIIAAALFFMFRFGDKDFWGIPILPIVGVIALVYASFLMTIVLGWVLMRGRDFRISIRRLFPFLKMFNKKK